MKFNNQNFLAIINIANCLIEEGQIEEGIKELENINKAKPIFVIGFGGYITYPVSIAAFIMRVPVYAHESNSIPGAANKINNLM